MLVTGYSAISYEDLARADAMFNNNKTRDGSWPHQVGVPTTGVEIGKYGCFSPEDFHDMFWYAPGSFLQSSPSIVWWYHFDMVNNIGTCCLFVSFTIAVGNSLVDRTWRHRHDAGVKREASAIALYMRFAVVSFSILLISITFMTRFAHVMKDNMVFIRSGRNPLEIVCENAGWILDRTDPDTMTGVYVNGTFVKYDVSFINTNTTTASIYTSGHMHVQERYMKANGLMDMWIFGFILLSLACVGLGAAVAEIFQPCPEI